MAGLTIGWEYLTGYAVATDPANRQRAEWPPHPGRVFMALAAAWFETGEDAAEGEVLRWLEGLDAPELHSLPTDRAAERTRVTVYVPVNDKAGPAAATLQSLPSMTRSKQPRAFPRVHVGDTPCFMHWPETDITDGQHRALDWKGSQPTSAMDQDNVRKCCENGLMRWKPERKSSRVGDRKSAKLPLPEKLPR